MLLSYAFMHIDGIKAKGRRRQNFHQTIFIILHMRKKFHFYVFTVSIWIIILKITIKNYCCEPQF